MLILVLVFVLIHKLKFGPLSQTTRTCQ